MSHIERHCDETSDDTWFTQINSTKRFNSGTWTLVLLTEMWDIFILSSFYLCVRKQPWFFYSEAPKYKADERAASQVIAGSYQPHCLAFQVAL